VVKNLADPVKSQDAKFRQLRTENEKIKQKLLACPSAVEYLKAIGFVEVMDGNETFLRFDGSIDIVAMQASLVEVSNGYEMVAGSSSMHSNDSTAAVASKKARMEDVEEKKTDDPLPPPINNKRPVASLSEKQKARLLMEEKEKREKEEARKHRAKQVALLKVDKHVRQNDENWTSGVSAAAAKSGTGMSTFRDRFGE
jgi:hypothetical protein